MKNIHFISGLPRSGTSLVANILKQNPEIHSETNSVLSQLIQLIHTTWNQHSTIDYIQHPDKKKGVIQGILNGYYIDIQNKNYIFDRDFSWISMIGLLESIIQQEIKVVVCVRNPAEILTSYERSRRENPLYFDPLYKGTNSIAGRVLQNANGPLGTAHRQLQDAITEGYLDRLLFVDYDRLCSSPRSQFKRIYDFCCLEYFDHNFNQIDNIENPNRIKLEKIVANPVAYLGLDLFQQFNKEIFWNAWI